MSRVLIRNGTLIDGTGSPAVSDAFVLIEEGKISALGHSYEALNSLTDIDLIDAKQGYILPGFIDAHVHLMSEGEDVYKMVTSPFSLQFYQAIHFLRQTLRAGVTAVRDAGGADLGLKQAVELGLIEGPRMQISIAQLSITGGHGDFWLPSGVDLSLSYPGYPDCRCDGVGEVRKKVREVLRAGADVIKVMATGGVTSPTDRPEHTQFTLEELEAIVEEGTMRAGVKVMAHAQGAEGIKNAVRAGVQSIEHGNCLDDEAIELMLKNDTFLVPTLMAPVSLLEAAKKDDLKWPSWAIEKVREVKEIHFQSAARAYRAGVKIAMGTDASCFPHGQNLKELSLLCSIGMSPMEAIVAGTMISAECLGWNSSLGTLEVGKFADLVITQTDPLSCIDSLADPINILFVIKGGKVVKDHRTEVTK